MRRMLPFIVALASLAVVPRARASHWESLTPDEQEKVVKQLQELIEKDLTRDDARFVRNSWDIGDEGEAEADDPLMKSMIRQLASLDGPALSKAAGSLSAGDYVPMRDFLVGKAAAEGGDALKEWTAKRFEKKGVGRLLFTTLAEQTGGFKALFTAMLDSRQSWCNVADVALSESRKAILTASRGSAEQIAKKTINWIVGEGPLASVGATPGDAYLTLLALDAEYFKALPRRLGAQSGGAFYDEYELARDRGLSPASAWDEIDITTSGGRWFEDLAGGSDGARRALERCYQQARVISPAPTAPRDQGYPGSVPSMSSVFIFQCIDRQIEETRQKEWSSLCTETEMAGAPTRRESAGMLAWLSESLRRLTEAQLAARGDATLAESQQIAGQARARLEELRRLRGEQARLCERPSLDALVAPGTAALAELDTLSRRDIDVELAIERLADCASLGSSDERVEAEAHDLSTRIRQHVGEANTASTAACDWPDPTTVAGAEDNLRTAARAGGRMGPAAAAARSELAELETLAAAVRNGSLGSPDTAKLALLRTARDEVNAAATRDARAAALAATCHAASASWGDRSSRLGRLRLAIEGKVDEIRQLTSQARGLLEASQIRAAAEQIRELSDDCDVQVSLLSSGAAAFRGTMVAVNLAPINERIGRERAALDACASLDAPLAPSPVSVVEDELASARTEVARLGAFQSAVDICVASAAAKVDALRRNAAKPPAADGTGSGGWTTVGAVQTIGTTAAPTSGDSAQGGSSGGIPSGSGGVPGPTTEDIDRLIQAAIDAYNNCQMGAALGFARRVQTLAPGHPWLASNLGLITKRQQAQANAAASLAAARSAAAAGDFQGALAAANRAAADSPSCMSTSISSSIDQVRDQMSAARANQRDANRQVFVQLVDSLISAWNSAATTGIAGPAQGSAAGAPAGSPRQVACSTKTEQGGDAPETVIVAVGSVAGTATMSWEFYDIEDRIVVEYGGMQLLDTGCVGGPGNRSLPLSGFGGQVVVRVLPNCKGKSGTQWNFTVDCPR